MASTLDPTPANGVSFGHRKALSKDLRQSTDLTAAEDAAAATSLDELLLSSARKMRLPLEPAVFQQPSTSAYVSRLTSLPLPSLLSEPEALKASATTLDADLGQLCFREYRTFIVAHEASTAISTSFDRLQQSLDGLLSSTATLEKASRGFAERVEKVLEERGLMGTVLNHLGKVEDLLEVPRLVATCVRVGNWHEAMDLGARVKELERRMAKGGQGTGVLKVVREEVDDALRGLRARVLEGLRSRDLKLLQAVRSVAVLRRMQQSFLEDDSSSATGAPPIAGLDEPSLRLAFLASRWDCLRSQLHQTQLASGLASLPPASQALLAADDPTSLTDERVRFVRRWIELWREVVGETVSVYAEIFLDGKTSALAPRTPPATQTAQIQLSEPPLPSIALDDALAPLTAFVSHSLEELFAFLGQQLSQLSSVASLTSVLTQLTYCAVAFGKWGFDFRGRVEDMVGVQVGRLVLQRMEDGVRGFKSEVKAGIGMAGKARNRRSMVDGGKLAGVEAWLIAPDSLRSVLSLPEPTTETLDPTEGTADGSDAVARTAFHPVPVGQPHSSLTLFPPLARFVNAHLGALNELRLFPSVDLLYSVSIAQETAIVEASEALLGLTKGVAVLEAVAPGLDGSTTDEEESPLTSQRRSRHAIAVAALQAWTRLVIPLLETGLRQGVYGELGEAAANATGLEEVKERCESEVARLQGKIEGPVETESVPPTAPTTPAVDGMLRPMLDGL